MESSQKIFFKWEGICIRIRTIPQKTRTLAVLGPDCFDARKIGKMGKKNMWRLRVRYFLIRRGGKERERCLAQQFISCSLKAIAMQRSESLPPQKKYCMYCTVAVSLQKIMFTVHRTVCAFQILML